MNDMVNLSRRRFLESSLLAGGGLVLGTYLPELRACAAEPANSGASHPLNAFVRIGADDTVTVLINHSEMGQGTYTALSMLVAEELDADWSKVRAEHAPVHPDYNHVNWGSQMVGGSTSVRSEWERLRKMGAAARAMLIAAAADQWGVEPAACTAEKHEVVHADSERRASFGQLAESAAKQTPPDEVPLKDPKNFQLIGKSLKRLDTPEKINGKAVFGLDVTLPGMLVAVVERPPVFGGKLKSFDATQAKAAPGVRHVVEIDRGVAVVADGFWQAKEAREQLEVEWDDGPLAALDSAQQREEYAALAKEPAPAARNQGDVAAALDTSAQKLEAEYWVPYLAHACMEPLNCVADVRADGCDVYTGTQFQTADHAAAVAITGLKPEQVKLHTTHMGGGFGRRGVNDSHFVREAVQISKAIQAPVKVVWTREDDTRGGYYRPSVYHAVSAGLDEAGKPTAWKHRIVCQSFFADTPAEQFVFHEGVDATAVEGASDLPYDVPNLLVDWTHVRGGVPTLWWRSVGHSHSAFVVESFLDELAHAAGQDPLEYRLALLQKHPRHKRALQLAAEQAGWGEPLPEKRGRGLAVHESFGSIVAQVAEVSVSVIGRPQVHRVVCAIDCGPVVNPDLIAAQMEGGIVYGLTAAFYGEISFKQGKVQQRNFNNYRMLRMKEMPVVETHIVPSTETMGGVGEPGVPPIAPAVANALFAATGKRVRQLPIKPADLRG